MSNEIKLIAKRIKELRSIFDVSASEMARVTGLSEAEYLEMESGTRDLSFTFLHKCAQRFNIDISELVTGDMPKLSKYTLSRAGEGMPIKRREGFDYQHIAPLLRDRLADPFVVTAKYSRKLEEEPIALSTHGGQELNYVLSGRLKIQIDNHIETLGAGDSVYYNASIPHGMVAIGGEDCVFISVVIKGESTGDDYKYVPVDLSAQAAAQDYLIYKKFVSETLDENGFLKDITFNPPANYNFAFDVLDELAKKCPDKSAMVWLSNTKEKRVFTFAEISKLSSKAANYLKSLGIGKGDKVILVLKRHYQFWFILNALHKLGAVAIPASNLLTAHDFEYRLNAAGIKAAICTVDNDIPKHLDEGSVNAPTLEVKISVNGKVEGWHDFDSEFEAYPDTFERPADQSIDDPMLMYFTSGTTGHPKIAVHSFAYPLGHIVTARYWHNVDPNGLHFTVSDTGWGKAVWGKIYGQWMCEAAVFTYDFDKFDAQDMLPLFKEHNITTFCAPPTIYRFFIKEDLKSYDLSSLKYVTTAGEALNPEVWHQFRAATGLKIMEGFGQTETTLTIANLVGSEPKPGSMGCPSPMYEVDIINAEGKPAKVGEVGEIVIRTDKSTPCGMFSGYYKDAEKTKSVWSDGVYHTCDMAWRDEDGVYWYVGRTDDVIKSSGYRIGPFEIESVLMELPYILECAVTGVPDETRGQVVKASIILVKGKEGTEELKKEIQEYVKERTAPYKYPRIVEFVSELPKTISGKIRRVEIRERHGK
jgi:acetyl-CoA synthetase